MSPHPSDLLLGASAPPARPAHRSFRLTRPAAPLAVAEQVRPTLVLREEQSRALLRAAAHQDVARGGCLSAGPAGVQVWSRPFDGPDGTAGTSELLGSVDWTYDTPIRHHVTVYRVVVTVAGSALGIAPSQLLRHVLRTAGVETEAAGADVAAVHVPPPRDPFRSALRRQRD